MTSPLVPPQDKEPRGIIPLENLSVQKVDDPKKPVGVGVGTWQAGIVGGFSATGWEERVVELGSPVARTDPVHLWGTGRDSGLPPLPRGAVDPSASQEAGLGLGVRCCLSQRLLPKSLVLSDPLEVQPAPHLLPTCPALTWPPPPNPHSSAWSSTTPVAGARR